MTESWLWALRQAPELMSILNRHVVEMNAIVDKYIAEEAERAAAHFDSAAFREERRSS